MTDLVVATDRTVVVSVDVTTLLVANPAAIAIANPTDPQTIAVDAGVLRIAEAAPAIVATAPEVFVQNTTPTVPNGQPYAWFQTGLGPGGDDFTLWFGVGPATP